MFTPAIQLSAPQACAVLASLDLERSRLGDVLHDTVCQSMSGLSLMTKVLGKKLRASAIGGEEFAKLGSAIRETAEQVHALARRSQAANLASRELIPALRDLTLCAANPAACEFFCPEAVSIPHRETALHLFRVAEEALANARQHAHATNILLSLTRGPDDLRLAVSDDGAGFAPSDVPSDRLSGLSLMWHRALVIGAKLLVHTIQGQGSTISCTLPLQNFQKANPNPSS